MDSKNFDRQLTQSIREARESAGISLNALSGMSGIPYATLYRKVEQDSGSLSARDVHVISKVLNISASDLFPEVKA
jgi:transcriptional regulator with XRE-family HTH domain